MNSVRKLRHELNMTQAEFAEFCSISVISVSRYESGGSLSRQNAEKIARACHVSVDYLLNNPSDRSHADSSEHFSLMLTSDEQSFISDYRRLSSRGRVRMRESMDEMLLLYPDSDIYGRNM